MAEKILVLGALGNVGAEVLTSLLATGREVRAGDIFPEKIQSHFGASVQAVPFDYGSPETFAPAFNDIQQAFIMRPPQISNIQKMMVPALEAAKNAGVRQMVFLSLIGIEQNKIVPHYKVEQWLRQSGLDYTFLRCSFFMQNMNTTHCAEIRDHGEIFVPVGHAHTSFIDVRDIGAVAALVLTQTGHENRAYDLTGSEALDYFQVAELFTRELGRKITYKNPSLFAYFWRQARQSPIMFALVTTWLYSNTRTGMAALTTNEVERLLGHPPIRMEQYIHDYRKYWTRRPDHALTS